MIRSTRGTLACLLLAGLAVALPAPAQAQAVGAAEESVAREHQHGGFVHAVYFWLRPDLTAEQVAAFVGGLNALRGIETVRHGWIGVPAATDRPIIERSYSYALTLVFADEAGQDAYQVHPVHDRFREEFGDFWTRVQIYDSVEPAHPH